MCENKKGISLRLALAHLLVLFGLTPAGFTISFSVSEFKVIPFHNLLFLGYTEMTLISLLF